MLGSAQSLLHDVAHLHLFTSPVSFDSRLAISPALRDQLTRIGVHSDWSLLLHLPLRYEDETRLLAIAELQPGESALIEAAVIDQQIQYRPRKQLLCRVADDSGELNLRYINFYPNQIKQLAVGNRLRFYGEPRQGFLGLEMIHPRAKAAGATEVAQHLTPVYPTTSGLSQATLSRIMSRALKHVTLVDTLPDALLQQLDLWPLATALHYLHAPPAAAVLSELEERYHPAWRRLQFDELLAQQLSLIEARQARQLQLAPRLSGGGQLSSALLRQLPFQLTRAQHRVVNEIARDLGQIHPMNRLLQGDVGSGKTIVAALAALQAIESGYQVAFMAPTEILAEQHFSKLRLWLEPLGVTTVWLTGSQKKKTREAGLAAIQDGSAQLAAGTHALFQEQVQFRQLGLVIVDEQHRFGVAQRLALRAKGRGQDGAVMQPHLLMMSATPIPRTLSMSYLADLDVSTIDELPPGRTPIQTKLISSQRRDQLMQRLAHYCADGRQAYWVCPLIEESEALELQTAQDTYVTLAASLPQLRIGLVHGRLSPAEKAATMGAFSRHELDVLVATTVIEVGVDVPNASLMVIDHAERFGLAQLHQLRGRVGRGAAESLCVLLYETPLSEMARQRLHIMHETTDGFEIARQDLHLRGPGEFLGARQSGAPMMRFADPEQHAELLEYAHQAALELLAKAPDIARAHVDRWHGGRAEWLKA